MTNTKTTPVEHVRLGAISAAIWANETEHGVRYAVTIERLYRDSESGSWKSSSSFNRDDLLVVGKVSDMVHTRIYEMLAANRDRDGGNQDLSADAEPKPPTPRAGGASATHAKAKAGAGR